MFAVTNVTREFFSAVRCVRVFSIVMNKKLKTEELNRLTPDAFKKAQKIPLTVVLDNVRSLHNVGSIFRTADAFAVERLFLCGITAVPPAREITKTAIGAEETVVWEYFDNTIDAVKQLQSEGYIITAGEQAQQSTSSFDVNALKGERFALILGNEVFGVSQDCIDLCDAVIEIEQRGTKHSLNVSVSGGVLMYEFFKMLR